MVISYYEINSNKAYCAIILSFHNHGKDECECVRMCVFARVCAQIESTPFTHKTKKKRVSQDHFTVVDFRIKSVWFMCALTSEESFWRDIKFEKRVVGSEDHSVDWFAVGERKCYLTGLSMS